MNLHKNITVMNSDYALVDHNVRLNLFTPGRAVFTVQASEPLIGVVIFLCSYDSTKLNRWFIGYVESSTTVDKKQQRLFCRELSAALFNRLPLALRDVTLKETLTAITNKTAIEFLISDQVRNYLNLKAPAFYNTSNGYHAMDALAAVYGIDKLIWQQQTNGQIFVGSWDDSRWASRPADIPNTWETQVSATNGATLPALPSIRPGVLYNNNIITGVEFVKNKMLLTWSANPWAAR